MVKVAKTSIRNKNTTVWAKVVPKFFLFQTSKQVWTIEVMLMTIIYIGDHVNLTCWLIPLKLSILPVSDMTFSRKKEI